MDTIGNEGYGSACDCCGQEKALQEVEVDGESSAPLCAECVILWVGHKLAGDA